MFTRVAGLEENAVTHADLAPLIQWQNWMERELHRLARQLDVKLGPKPPRP